MSAVEAGQRSVGVWERTRAAALHGRRRSCCCPPWPTGAIERRPEEASGRGGEEAGGRGRASMADRRVGQAAGGGRPALAEGGAAEVAGGWGVRADGRQGWAWEWIRPSVICGDKGGGG
jgi:hypothetical protein